MRATRTRILPVRDADNYRGTVQAEIWRLRTVGDPAIDGDFFICQDWKDHHNNNMAYFYAGGGAAWTVDEYLTWALVESDSAKYAKYATAVAVAALLVLAAKVVSRRG